eukprot:c37296_g1_i1 orf=187-435(+)
MLTSINIRLIKESLIFPAAPMMKGSNVYAFTPFWVIWRWEQRRVDAFYICVIIKASISFCYSSEPNNQHFTVFSCCLGIKSP